VRRIQVIIVRSERESAALSVGAWEIDILRLVHGAQNVAVGEAITDKSEYPDASTEFDRLCRRYGEDRENGGAPYAAQVFGAMGANRLADLIEREQGIEEGTVDFAPPVVVPPPARKPKKTSKQPVTPIDE
jgi:hypothetical protein